jgi:hypothetical protein
LLSLWRLAFLFALVPAVVLFAGCKRGTPEEQTAIVELLEFISDDGFLALAFPGDLVDDDFDLTIKTVPADQIPSQLGNLSGGGTVYQLEPFGLTFEKPVQATLKLNLDGLQGFPMGGADAYALIGLSEDGEREPLSDLSTDYSLGEAFLTSFGTTTMLPQFIGRTKGSLRAEMDEISTLPVGEGAAVEFTLRNTARPEDGVTLKSASGEAIGSGAISITVPPAAEPADLAAGATTSDDFDIKCADEPATGVYTLDATATSIVEGGSPTGTPLRVVLDNVVDCVEGEATTQPTTKPGDELGFPAGLSAYLLNWGVPETLLPLVAFTEDPAGDHFYSDPSKEAGFTPEYTDLSGVFAARVTITEEAAATLNSLYTCGATAENGVQTVCPNPSATTPPGEALIIGGPAFGELPSIPDRFCTMASLFDAGTPWQAQAPFTADLYAGAGIWYEVTIDPNGGVNAKASRVGSDGSPRNEFSSNSRFFIDRANLTTGGVIPLSEVTGATGYRATAFCGDQTFDPARSGGDVAPGALPTEFRKIPADVITLAQICGGTCVEPASRERIL